MTGIEGEARGAWSGARNDEGVPIRSIKISDRRFWVIDLPELLGEHLERLPVCLRLLAENVARTTRGEVRLAAIRNLVRWLDDGSSTAEVDFLPSRLLMHDTTGTPAMVDIAAMRDELAESGHDPLGLNPAIRVDMSVDHSLAVEDFGHASAAARNLAHEMRRNKERYAFLKWAESSLENVHIYPPGTGIMHTVNLEQLATVVAVEEHGGEEWLIPDMMLGTDSHTPMINGLGVLGWGVGGLEAQTVMFGMPATIRIPNVVGVHLSGALSEGTVATDLALTITARLRELGVAGDFVEFFGPGVCTLTVGERAVVANMAPEYGASTGYFPIDDQCLDYLRRTGRSDDLVERVRAYARLNGLWFDPEATPRFSRVVNVDLSDVTMRIAGPRRPQDLLPFAEIRRALESEPAPACADENVAPAFPVAIAAITSCTNTSDPRLLVAAGLLARTAGLLGLTVDPSVKTSLAPGSPAAATYLERVGLTTDLANIGFDIVGFGCTTCIGNPGPLTQTIKHAQAEARSEPIAILSGNRNFPGRVHPEIELSFIMSPPLVVAFALAGDAKKDLSCEPVQHTKSGRPVFLHELWPTKSEIDAVTAAANDPLDFRRDFQVARRNPLWRKLTAQTGARFDWDPASTTLRRPPFAGGVGQSALGEYIAFPLLIVGDDITTDHISPASGIPEDSEAARFLVSRGQEASDLNVFASYRGNWEVMVRGAFYAKSLSNRLAPHAPVGHTLHVPSGDIMTVWTAAEAYRVAGDPVVIIAGERYGMGSSRDWAAKVQLLLGVRAVIAGSFERIHRSNLIGMGILPLTVPAESIELLQDLGVGDRIRVSAAPENIRKHGPIAIVILRSDGAEVCLSATAEVATTPEVNLLRNGGVIPTILERTRQAGVDVAEASQE